MANSHLLAPHTLLPKLVWLKRSILSLGTNVVREAGFWPTEQTIQRWLENWQPGSDRLWFHRLTVCMLDIDEAEQDLDSFCESLTLVRNWQLLHRQFTISEVEENNIQERMVRMQDMHQSWIVQRRLLRYARMLFVTQDQHLPALTALTWSSDQSLVSFLRLTLIHGQYPCELPSMSQLFVQELLNILILFYLDHIINRIYLSFVQPIMADLQRHLTTRTNSLDQLGGQLNILEPFTQQTLEHLTTIVRIFIPQRNCGYYIYDRDMLLSSFEQCDRSRIRRIQQQHHPSLQYDAHVLCDEKGDADIFKPVYRIPFIGFLDQQSRQLLEVEEGPFILSEECELGKIRYGTLDMDTFQAREWIKIHQLTVLT